MLQSSPMALFAQRQAPVTLSHELDRLRELLQEHAVRKRERERERERERKKERKRERMDE